MQWTRYLYLNFNFPACSICLLQQNHVVVNIHGHTHDSPGRVTIGKTVVINPGPLQYVASSLIKVTTNNNNMILCLLQGRSFWCLHPSIQSQFLSILGTNFIFLLRSSLNIEFFLCIVCSSLPMSTKHMEVFKFSACAGNHSYAAACAARSTQTNVIMRGEPEVSGYKSGVLHFTPSELHSQLWRSGEEKSWNVVLLHLA